MIQRRAAWHAIPHPIPSRRPLTVPTMRHRARNHSSSSSSSLSLSRIDSSHRHRRSQQIRSLDSALSQTPIPLEQIRQLSIGGFEDDTRRKVIWPMLLGVDVKEMDEEAEQRRAAAAANAASTAGAIATPATKIPYDYSTGIIYEHKYYDQIEKDINRSMFHFDITRAFKEKKRSASRLALGRIIHTIFSMHSELHYVQGFHDIASVFLLVCHDSSSDPSQPFSRHANARGEELAFRLTERLALLHIRDSLRPSLDTVVEVLSLIFPLLRVADPIVHDFLVRTNVQSFFTLSWILTWFSHNLEHFQEVCRVFDFFLSSHPLMPLYATVALIIQLRVGLLDLRNVAIRSHRQRNNLPLHVPIGSLPSDEEVEVDLSAVHEYFQRLPPVLDLDDLFRRTQQLYAKHPPLNLILAGKLKIPRDSPLLASAVDGLASKLKNYLAWQSNQHAQQVKDGTWGVVTRKTNNNNMTRRQRSNSSTVTPSSSSSSSSNVRSFYAYPSLEQLRLGKRRRSIFMLAILVLSFIVAVAATIFVINNTNG